MGYLTALSATSQVSLLYRRCHGESVRWCQSELPASLDVYRFRMTRGDGRDQAGHLKYVDDADEDGCMQSLSNGDITWRVLESVRGTESCRAASSLRTTSNATDDDLYPWQDPIVT